MPNVQRMGRRLSYILRHDPASIGASVDPAGWMDTETLLQALKLDRNALDEIVAADNKNRFEYSEDGKRLRARQGHSLDVNLGYEAAEPPEVLYHGTATKNLGLIYRDGISKMDRHAVHLHEDPATAVAVGQRHGKPIVLAIKTRPMIEAGQEFFLTGNNVWLVDHVPPEAVEVAGNAF